MWRLTEPAGASQGGEADSCPRPPPPKALQQLPSCLPQQASEALHSASTSFLPQNRTCGSFPTSRPLHLPFPLPLPLSSQKVTIFRSQLKRHLPRGWPQLPWPNFLIIFSSFLFSPSGHLLNSKFLICVFIFYLPS